MPPVDLSPKHLLDVIDDLMLLVDRRKLGPSGCNLDSIDNAYAALAAGVTSGVRTQITASLAREIQENGWDIGFKG